MGYNDKTFLSLAGLLTGIFLVNIESSPLLLSIIPVLSLAGVFFSRRTLFFTAFLLAGILSASLATGIPENHIINRSSAVNIPRAEGRVLEVKPFEFSDAYVVQVKAILTPEGRREKTCGRILLSTPDRNRFTPGDCFTAKDIRIRRILPPQNPGVFDYRGFMQRRGIYAEGRAASITRMDAGKSWLRLALQGARDLLSRRVERLFAYSPEEKELVETLLLGKEKIPSFLREAGIRSGTYHLLVISGLHIAFIVLFLRILFIPLGRFNNAYPRFFPFFSLLFTWFYAGITGFRTPVVRAVLMFTFFNAGEIMEREVDGLHSIMTAMLVLLLARPYSLLDASFQLSFMATAGIILACRRFNLLKRNFLQGTALSSISAQAAVLPLIFYHFGVFYPAGIINNIVFLPSTGIIIISSLLALALPLVFLPPLKILLSLFLKGLTLSAGFAPAVAFSSGLAFAIIFYCTIFLVFFARKNRKLSLILASVIVTSLSVSIAVSCMRTYPRKKAYFFSFGKPSLAFIMDNRSVVFLADHYKQQEISKILVPLLKAEKTGRITGLFYTDISYNHSGTLRPLLETTEITRVYEQPDVLKSFSFPYMNSHFYRVTPDIFQFASDDKTYSMEGLEVQTLGTENNTVSYIVRKGHTSILVAPYIGETLAERIHNRRFTVAFIGDIKKTAGVARSLGSMGYLYLVIPSEYKKFAILPEPRIRKFCLKTGSVEMIFDRSPFSISYFYE